MAPGFKDEHESFIQRIFDKSISLPCEDIFRLTVAQYHDMIGQGILTCDDRVELLEGLLIQQMPESPRHSAVTGLVAEMLRSTVPAGWYVTTHQPVTMDASEPEPDVAIVQGSPRDYLEGHPRPEQLALLVEVADSSINRDRGIKRHVYTRAGVPIYWIFDVGNRRIECYTLPTGPQSEPPYQSVQYFSEEEAIPVTIAGIEVGLIAVGDILP